MSVLTLQQPSRWLDSIVLGFMLMFLSGISLYGFGLAHSFILSPEVAKAGKNGGANAAPGSPSNLAGLIPPQVPMFAERIFPMPGKKWTFSLTHILLFSIMVVLLSMTHHPAQDRIEENAIGQQKKNDKKKAKEMEKTSE